MSSTPQILVVEDDNAIRALLVAALRREPFDVHSAVNGADALQKTRVTEYAVILLDLMMPTLNGVQFLEAFHADTPQSRTVIFVMTAGDETAIRRLPPNLVHGFVRKPFDIAQLVAMIREVALTRNDPGAETASSADVSIAEAAGEFREEPAN